MKNLFFCTLVPVLMASASALAGGSDELWEVTTKMEMPGMPFAMPAQTQNICIQKGRENDPNNSVPKNKDQDCKMSDVKVSGNKSSWKMKCEGKHPMTGEGEMTRGDGSYSGKTAMHSKDGDMTMTYSGKKVGSCDFATDSPQAKMNSMMQQNEAVAAKEQAKECKAALDEDHYNRFLKPDCSWAKDAAGKKMCEQMSCTDMRPQMCDRLSKKMGSADGYKEVAGNKDAYKLAEECGLPFEKITRDFCRKQLDARNYEDVAQYCEKEARPLFDKNCAGRDYTSAMDSKFAPICRRYGKWNSRPTADTGGDNSASSNKPAAEKKSDSGKDDAVNKALEGAKSLKGLLHF